LSENSLTIQMDGKERATKALNQLAIRGIIHVLPSPPDISRPSRESVFATVLLPPASPNQSGEDDN
jgi:hypothetical protein